MMFVSTVETVIVVCGAFACLFTLVGAVHLITNDYEKYNKDARIWVDSMMLLMAVTGIWMLAMDYPNTKPMLHSFIIGFAAAFLAYIFDSRRSARRKEETL